MNPTKRLDNLGDEVIFVTLARLLQKYGALRIKGRSEIFLGEFSPDGSLLVSRIRRVIHRLRGGVIVNVSAPGGGIAAQSKVIVVEPKPSFFRRLVKMVIQEKCILIGSSVPQQNPGRNFRPFDWYGLRDHESLRALQGAGIDSATYFPDLAFLIEKRQAVVPETIRTRILFSLRKDVPDVKVDSDRADLTGAAFDQIVHSLPSAKRKYASLFFQVDEDFLFMKELAKKSDLDFRHEKLNRSDFMAFYANGQVVVSNRLHCLLFGAIGGAVPIALIYREHRKIVSLFETVGWEGLIVYVEEYMKVNQRFMRIMENINNNKLLVDEVISEQRQKGFSTLLDNLNRIINS